MDCLVLIPVDEGFVHIDTDSARGSGEVAVAQYADGNYAGYQTDGGQIVGVAAKANVTGGVPPGSCAVVIAAERETQSVLTDTCDILLKVYQRWESLRGADT
jgi:hypothetical protein